MPSNIRLRAEIFFSAWIRSRNRHASFVGILGRASLPRICLTSLSASIVLRSRVRAERPQALAWAFPSPTGLWNVMGVELKSIRAREWGLRSRYGSPYGRDRAILFYFTGRFPSVDLPADTNQRHTSDTTLPAWDST